MDKEFRLIAITRPEGHSAKEADVILRLLGNENFWRVHIRKDSPFDSRALLALIPERLRHRISLHNATFEDVQLFPGIGVHLTGKTPQVPAGFKGTVSISCHTLDEVALAGDSCAYVFLSPIYDSVSKTGYKGAFSHSQLIEASKNGLLKNVIALGGVRSAKIEDVRHLGFYGAAMLGEIWENEEI